jgi:5-methylcytosine-specific restriction endonuclease McrA
MTARGKMHSCRWRARREAFRAGILVGEHREDPQARKGRKAAKRERIKRHLWDAQQGRCAYCGHIFAAITDATIDHLVPKAKGGTGAISNLRLACLPCNQAKGDWLPGDEE